MSGRVIVRQREGESEGQRNRAGNEVVHEREISLCVYFYMYVVQAMQAY